MNEKMQNSQWFENLIKNARNKDWEIFLGDAFSVCKESFQKPSERTFRRLLKMCPLVSVANHEETNIFFTMPGHLNQQLLSSHSQPNMTNWSCQKQSVCQTSMFVRCSWIQGQNTLHKKQSNSGDGRFWHKCMVLFFIHPLSTLFWVWILDANGHGTLVTQTPDIAVINCTVLQAAFACGTLCPNHILDQFDHSTLPFPTSLLPIWDTQGHHWTDSWHLWQLNLWLWQQFHAFHPGVISKGQCALFHTPCMSPEQWQHPCCAWWLLWQHLVSVAVAADDSHPHVDFLALWA